MGNKAAKGAPPPPSATQAGDGIRSMETSAGFRALNFELYMKPNKPIMAFGITKTATGFSRCGPFLPSLIFFFAQNPKNK